MKSIFIIIFLITNVIAQDVLPYDATKVVNEKELNLLLTNKRGIKHKGIVYYVESNLNTITAYKKEGAIKWKLDVSKVVLLDEGYVGEPCVRFMKIDKNKLIFVYAKHEYGKIELKTGKVIYLGAD